MVFDLRGLPYLLFKNTSFFILILKPLCYHFKIMYENVIALINQRISSLREDIKVLECTEETRKKHLIKKNLEVLKSTLQTNLDLLINFTTNKRH